MPETAESYSTSQIRVAGVMSGTSLDGMDIALTVFTKKNQQWKYKIEKAVTIPYPPAWKEKLARAMSLSEKELKELDLEYGRYIGLHLNEFFRKILPPQFISSHGHTVFHQPEKGISLQIGNGEEIARICKMTVINDFRSLDISLGGQGAPLVPVGDRDLFSEYEACLNLGGFSNISFDEGGIRKAFDICPVNFVLNHFSMKKGQEYDKNGATGRKGKLIPALLQKMENLDYYKKQGPSSLGAEWVQSEFLPVISGQGEALEDIMRTVYEHIALRISAVVNGKNIKKLLVTGGGALNDFLIEMLQNKMTARIVIPDETILNYKEAMVFAYLGLLRTKNEINCLASVTGAVKDCCCGKINIYP